jgi:platelet-activating factor acetylhydrolase
MCGDFATHGFVVCSLEHRDGSGPTTYVNSPVEETEDTFTNGKGKDRSYQMSSERLDHVFPKGNTDDT